LAVTIYDIAERAEVSIATVSRVFNGHPRVSPPTRRRVLAAAEEMGYEPHASARSLARQTTHLISAVVPMLTSYFFMEVIRGMQDRLEESAFDLLVYASRTLERVDAQLARAAQKGRSDGLLLVSTPLTAERARHLKSSGRPAVLVDSQHPDFDSVSIDNRKGAAEAVRHLLALGRQRIALILPNPESGPAISRRRGYEDALEEAGVPLDERLVWTSPEQELHGYTREAGFEGMKALLARGPAPDAVFAASDVQALGALWAARARGLRVPEDLAVIGFDDIRTSAYVGLSTLRQPMYEMGKVGVEKLLRRIADPSLPTSHTQFTPRLVARHTTTGSDDAALADDALGLVNEGGSPLPLPS
jgi:LacI family transcriptional regulator